MRQLTIIIAAGVVVSMGFAVVLIVWHEVMMKAVGTEAYKTLLQFVMVAVLGGGVSLLYQAFNREAERRAESARRSEERAVALRETRQRYLHDLIAHYNVVKRARRLLRATALSCESNFLDRRVRVARYDELLQTVLDAQLALETMSRTMRVEDSLFATELGLIASLSSAEAYLRSLITEYENSMPRADQPEVDLREMPELADFIGPYTESERFRRQFIHQVQAAMAILERLIAGPALA